MQLNLRACILAILILFEIITMLILMEFYVTYNFNHIVIKSGTYELGFFIVILTENYSK